MPLSPRRASNLRPPGRSPCALPVCYATDVVEKPKTQTTTRQWKIPTAAFCGRTFSVYQEQQLFMGWPAPSPPRSATGRDDGAQCGAGPPCTFRYARILLFICDMKTWPLIPKLEKHQPLETRILRWYHILPGV